MEWASILPTRSRSVSVPVPDSHLASTLNVIFALVWRTVSRRLKFITPFAARRSLLRPLAERVENYRLLCSRDTSVLARARARLGKLLYSAFWGERDPGRGGEREREGEICVCVYTGVYKIPGCPGCLLRLRAKCESINSIPGKKAPLLCHTGTA